MDQRLYAPATARNRHAILEVLRRVLPKEGIVLEIASGTGEHACYFASELPHLIWQPTDPNPDALDSIASWATHTGATRVRPPLPLDVHQEDWPTTAAAVVCINMIHIAPWTACLALLAGAACVLPRNGVLFLYGPFWREGYPAAPSNLQFDASLRHQDPAWGIRSLEEVEAAAQKHAFARAMVTEMPANNLAVVFKRNASSEES